MNFKTQLQEDLNLIQRNWGHLDNNLKKSEYAFNYWVLNKIYDVDEEIIPTLITEYNDKSIDCWVHYEDSKELFIIQNKFYDEKTTVSRKDITDFLSTPVASLVDGNYKKSKELQKVFNSAKNDPDYKIFLHFYVTNEKRSYDTDTLVKQFNKNPPSFSALIKAEIFTIDKIQDFYYGESFKENVSFNFTFTTINKGTVLAIRPEEYKLKNMPKAFYILTPVQQLYNMSQSAQEKGYQLFESNIREYLGKNAINKGIMETLKNPKDRSNFFYYNNGVTIICKDVKTGVQANAIEVIKPQIVNGCQTVNSIQEVLTMITKEEIESDFKETFVMVKILQLQESKETFYRDVVKYTNKQNSINENAFGAKNELFSKLQDGFRQRGFLLLKKPSDKNTFLSDYAGDAKTNELLKLANVFSKKIGIELSELTELFIPLDKLLQVYLAFIKDGHLAYTKKNAVLKETTDIYKDYSLKINKYISFDNLIRLYLIYLKAEKERSASNDLRTPIPYYVIGFLGNFITNKDNCNRVLEDLFDNKNFVFDSFYKYLSKLTKRYKNNQQEQEYNVMIKKPIDKVVLAKQIDDLNDILLDSDTSLKQFLEELNKS